MILRMNNACTPREISSPVRMHISPEQFIRHRLHLQLPLIIRRLHRIPHNNLCTIQKGWQQFFKIQNPLMVITGFMNNRCVS